jgi:hypothetical protein
MAYMKKIFRGTIPYLFYSLFAPRSEKTGYLKYIGRHGATHYPYEFTAEYAHAPVQVLTDEQRGLPYVIHRAAKRLYFPKTFSAEKFATAERLEFAVCTYHRRDDLKVLSAILTRYGCHFELRKGLLFHKHHLRPCLLRGRGRYFI